MALHVWLVEGFKLILNVEQILKVPVLATIYNDWHNDRYFKQCFHNIQEKYDRGIISEEEWLKIENIYK